MSHENAERRRSIFANQRTGQGGAFLHAKTATQDGVFSQKWKCRAWGGAFSHMWLWQPKAEYFLEDTDAEASGVAFSPIQGQDNLTLAIHIIISLASVWGKITNLGGIFPGIGIPNDWTENKFQKTPNERGDKFQEGRMRGETNFRKIKWGGSQNWARQNEKGDKIEPYKMRGRQN